MSSPQMALHSLRTYYFSAILRRAEVTPKTPSTVRLSTSLRSCTMWGLFEDPRPFAEHCFSVGSAREARRIAKQGGWDDSRLDRMAVADHHESQCTRAYRALWARSPFYARRRLGRSHCEEWEAPSDNLAESLARYPRTGFAEDALALDSRESILNPRGRFACMGPIFPVIVRRASFSLESRS